MQQVVIKFVLPPKCIAKSRVKSDGNGVDDRVYLERSFFELHDGCVVDAHALWEDQDRGHFWVAGVHLQSIHDDCSLLGFRTLEEDVRRGSAQDGRQNAQDPGMSLTHHVIAVMRCQHQGVNGGGVVCHSDTPSFGGIVDVVESRHERQGPGYEVKGEHQELAVYPPLEGTLWEHPNGRHAHTQVEEAQQQDYEAQGEEDQVAHEDAHHPAEGEPKGNELVGLVGARQEVPLGQLLGLEVLRDAVVRDGGHARGDVPQDVVEVEVLFDAFVHAWSFGMVRQEDGSADVVHRGL